MKKQFFGLFVLVFLLVCFTNLYAQPTVSNPHRPLRSIPNANVIGGIQVTFDHYLEGNHRDIEGLNEAAYNALLGAASLQYSGDIDVVDITWVKVGRVRGRHQYNANGRVVNTTGGVEGALERATDEVSEAFTSRTRLAIVYITARERGLTEYITGELEHILRRQGFVIIDRSELDRIREEQRFGTSGEVDDRTAARIGQIAGASVVITGRVDGDGDLRRLRLRALDTSTGQVVGTASERL